MQPRSIDEETTRMRRKTEKNADILNVRNLGPVSATWLRAVGIRTREDLEKTGSTEAYIRIVMHGFKPTLNLLYALEAGLRGVHWTKLSKHVKEKLKRAVGGTQPLKKGQHAPR